MGYFIGAVLAAWLIIAAVVVRKKKLIGRCSGCDGDCKACPKAKLR